MAIWRGRGLLGTSITCALLVACSSDSSPPVSSAAGAAGHAGGGLAGAGPGPGGAGAGAISGNGGQAALGGGGVAGGFSGNAGSGGNAGNGGNAGLGGLGGEGGVPGPFELTSPAFDEGGLIEVKYRCTGDNVTPALSWSRGPAGTQSYALTMIHVGSQSLHWVLWDVPPETRTLPEGIAREALPAVPAGAKQVKPNVDGSDWYGYTGPCPGGQNQSYTFFVYALDVATLPGITPDANVTAADAAVKEHQLAVATLTGMASK